MPRIPSPIGHWRYRRWPDFLGQEAAPSCAPSRDEQVTECMRTRDVLPWCSLYCPSAQAVLPPKPMLRAQIQTTSPLMGTIHIGKGSALPPAPFCVERLLASPLIVTQCSWKPCQHREVRQFPFTCVTGEFKFVRGASTIRGLATGYSFRCTAFADFADCAGYVGSCSQGQLGTLRAADWCILQGNKRRDDLMMLCAILSATYALVSPHRSFASAGKLAPFTNP